jgi:signal transduction histidine kinase
MTRRTVLIGLVVAALLAALAGGLIRLVQRQRAALLAAFTAERMDRLEDAVRDIEVGLADIQEDLRLAGQLVLAARSPEEREREMGALLAVVRHYRQASLYDGQGRVALAVVDPRAGRLLLPASFSVALAVAATRAQQRPPGAVETSPAITGDPEGWFRVFAMALPKNPDPLTAGGAIALLVDTRPLFSKGLQLLGSGGARVLLLGAHGRPTPATDPGLAHLLGEHDSGRPAPPVLTGLIGDMRAGRRGTRLLSEAEAAAFGLPRERALFTYAPVRLRGGDPWSLAMLSSAAVLRPQEQALLLRAAALAAAVVAALAAGLAYALYAARRAAALRERLRHAEELAHLSEKTEKILDHIPTGVMVLSEDERITALNRVLRQRVPAAAVGAGLAQALPAAPAPVIARLRDLIDSARATDRVRSLFGARLDLFGEEGQYSLHAVPLERRFPEARLLLVIEDLSELRALTTQLLRAEKLATVGVLAAGIAHEIGTPLSVVRGRTEYIIGKLGPDHPQAGRLQIIVEQIDYVTRTIRKLLDFARPTVVAVRPVAVLPVVRAVVDLFHFEAERRRLTIAVEVPEVLPVLAAEPDQLQQVLVNLVMNACDACSPGGRVRIAARAPDGPGARVLLEVTDDGCGIPEEHRHQVFDPFFTTKKRGQGSGLGLTVAAQIVRNHGGQIEIESEPRKGTRVIVLWPVAAYEEEAHAATG